MESRLFLVDLGGSERVNKSKANEDRLGRPFPCLPRERATRALSFGDSKYLSEAGGPRARTSAAALTSVPLCMSVGRGYLVRARPFARAPGASPSKTLLEWGRHLSTRPNLLRGGKEAASTRTQGPVLELSLHVDLPSNNMFPKPRFRTPSKPDSCSKDPEIRGLYPSRF